MEVRDESNGTHPGVWDPYSPNKKIIVQLVFDFRGKFSLTNTGICTNQFLDIMFLWIQGLGPGPGPQNWRLDLPRAQGPHRFEAQAVDPQKKKKQMCVHLFPFSICPIPKPRDLHKQLRAAIPSNLPQELRQIVEHGAASGRGKNYALLFYFGSKFIYFFIFSLFFMLCYAYIYHSVRIFCIASCSVEPIRNTGVSSS